MNLEIMHRIVRDLTCLSNIYVSCFTSELRVRLVTLNMFKPSSFYSADLCKAVLLLWVIFCCLFHVCLRYAVLSVPCSLLITCWERADPLALLCVVLSCVFANFQYGFPRQVWYLIVSIPDLCPPLYFVISFII